MCCLGSLSLSLEKGPAWKEQTEGSISFMLAKRDAPPELLPGTAGLEMEQISVLILVMLGSAHSQLLVRVSVSPLGVEQAWPSYAAAALSPSPAEPFLPGLWPPQITAERRAHGSLSSVGPRSLCRLLLPGCLQAHLLQLFFLPFLCSLERNPGHGLNKSHSQPAKPPPCSPGKCGLCRDTALGLGGTRANHQGPTLGRGLGQGRGLEELLEGEGTCPVLPSPQMS